MKAPTAGVLRVGGANVYVGNRKTADAVKIATGTKSHSWGWSEGAHLPARLKGLKGYDALIAFGADDAYDANDNVMMVAKSLDVVHFSMTRACEDVPGSKVGHQRQFSMLAYEAPMLGAGVTVCHFSVHPNWVAGLDSASHPVVREYVDSMVVLRAMLEFATSMGWHIVVTGDFNSRKGDNKSYETLYDVVADFGLRVRTEGIDGVAYDRRLAVSKWRVIRKALTGSDHDWIVVDLRKRGRRRKTLRSLLGLAA